MTWRHVDNVHWCCSLSTDVSVLTRRKGTCRVLLHVSAAWRWRQHHDSDRCAAVFIISFVSTVRLSLCHVADNVSWLLHVLTHAGVRSNIFVTDFLSLLLPEYFIMPVVHYWSISGLCLHKILIVLGNSTQHPVIYTYFWDACLTNWETGILRQHFKWRGKEATWGFAFPSQSSDFTGIRITVLLYIYFIRGHAVA
jgi:hypothetical protein